jgi:membrane protease YdiL (CAAX protease family)
MQDPVLNSSMLLVIVTASVLSLAAGFFLFQRHIDGQPLLQYEPRRRVPWGPLVLVIPLFFIGVSILGVLGDSETTVELAVEPPDSQEFIYGGLLTAALMLAFVVTAIVWLLAERKADRQDLGLPADKVQLWRDAGVGVVACMAALLPIYLINLTLVESLNSRQNHPLVEELLKHPSPGLMLVGFLSAVVAAPLFEEFTFRVLLQGWLERLEDERLDYAATLRTPVEVVHDPADADATTPVLDPVILAADAPRPAAGWIPALPHGWTPIFVSAVAFGLAHLGHGVAPVPLVLLGIVLGYLYQRTHRLAPSIAAHMLFNAYSLTLLWLQMGRG